MLLKFVDREDELESLKRLHESRRAEFVVVYGRRRMGKTALIKEFTKERKHFYFLAKQQDMALEFERFKEGFARRFNIFLGGKNWEELFEEITEKIREKLVLVIDEFPYWIARDEGILSEFQYIWDEILSEKDVMVVLLGSYVSVMEQKVMGYKSPLYGRRTAQMEIKQLPLRSLAEFFPGYGTEDLIRVYGMLDTIPYYLTQFDGSVELWRNVRETFLNPSSPLHMDAEILLSAELREYNTYFNIIKAILDGATKMNEISGRARVDITNISKYLRVLEGMKLIRKVKPLTASPKEKNYLYELEDNYLRFWLTYVYPFREDIEEHPEEHLESVKRDYPRYMGRIFERLVEKSARELTGFPQSGRWWYKDTEIDLLALGDKEVLFGECKWQSNVDADMVLGELKAKSELVRIEGREKRYAIFAISFKERSGECMCFDLRDIGRIFGR